jgi:hypothetical protein
VSCEKNGSHSEMRISGCDIVTLEMYRSVIGYSVMDLKGISPSLYTDRIPMEQDHKTILEHQQ